jgi:toxin-antitoxin system PIN domain toxin
MSASVDANILIYAANVRDPMHLPARSLIERLSTGPDLLYLFWPTIMAYLRITTNQRILQEPLPANKAIENIDGLLGLPHVVSPSEGEAFWRTYLASGGPVARGKAVSDTHLATLLREHGVRVLYTRDSDFRRFEFLDVRNPFSYAIHEGPR